MVAAVLLVTTTATDVERSSPHAPISCVIIAFIEGARPKYTIVLELLNAGPDPRRIGACHLLGS